MRDTFIIALEASWEHDPIRLDDKLWGVIAKKDEVCYNTHDMKRDVEEVSNVHTEMRQPCGLMGLIF